MKAHFRMLAGYNAWANRRLYAAVLALPPGAAARDLGAFFRSPLATLNHVMVADLVWLARLRAIAPPPFDLDHVLHDDMAELDLARRALDDDICRAVEETDPAATIRYRRGDAEMAAPAAELLAHLFNHQTHHRGQVHAMLTRLAAEGVGAGV
ncbi:MAG: DinB family protein, partial [Pseudomonadota bacterium]